MAEFRFKNTKKSFEVKDENGELIKRYILDVGNEEFTKRILERVKKLDDLSDLDTTSPESVDRIRETEKEIVTALFGEGEWLILYEACGHNFMSMLALINAAADLLKEGPDAGV